MKSPSAKIEIRRQALALRNSLAPAEKALKDKAIMERLLSMPEFKEARTCVLFASFRSEVNTLPIIEAALSAGKRIILPRVEKDSLSLYEISRTDDLRPGYMGIPEPSPGEAVKRLDEADIILVPGAAFDEEGGRLGYGKGYYDKLLSGPGSSGTRPEGRRGTRLPIIALAYELQIRQRPLPVLPHDVRVDLIVTEERVIACGRGKD